MGSAALHHIKPEHTAPVNNDMRKIQKIRHFEVFQIHKQSCKNTNCQVVIRFFFFYNGHGPTWQPLMCMLHL